MTRANFLIVTRSGKYKMQGNSSCYPSHMMASVLTFATSTASDNSGAINGFYDEPDSLALSEFIQNCGLTLGYVGNPNYYYEIDFVNQVVKVFGTKSRWINAPEDWEAKGWRGLYKGENGRMGYKDHWIKGKCIYQKSLKDLVEKIVDHEVVLREGVITEAELIKE